MSFRLAKMIFFPHDYIDGFEKSKRKSKNKKFYN